MKKGLHICKKVIGLQKNKIFDKFGSLLGRVGRLVSWLRLRTWEKVGTSKMLAPVGGNYSDAEK